jgi:hypothetical protein
VLEKLKSAQTLQLRKLWHQVRMSYFTELQAFHNKRIPAKERVLKNGNLVLIKNDWSARNYWPIGRVKETIAGSDGKIRTVWLEKYVPNEINRSLALEKYGVRAGKHLTKIQRKELTGFFKPLEEAQAVKNLIPFELWRGNKFEHPADALSRHFGPTETLLKNIPKQFENFTVPVGKRTNDTFMNYEKQRTDIQDEAKNIHLFSGSMKDEEVPECADYANLKFYGLLTH